MKETGADASRACPASGSSKATIKQPQIANGLPSNLGVGAGEGSSIVKIHQRL